ncbi:MAG TPA: hypothetical protein VKX33_09550 [Cyclobacteriaceae bacterium]|nr:hypothetical protein [Cyclobacteriaceae bacterium]
MKDYPALKDKYRITERNLLLLILLPLPFFAIVYLNLTKPVRTFNIPEIPEIIHPFLVALSLALLMFQQINFQRSIRNLKATGVSFEEKVLGYLKATSVRYVILAVVGFIATFGLLFYGSVGFIILYAMVLILVSVLKPSPHRITRIFKFKDDEKEFVNQIHRNYIE